MTTVTEVPVKNQIEAHELIFVGKAVLAKDSADDEELKKVAEKIVRFYGIPAYPPVITKVADKAIELMQKIPYELTYPLPITRAYLWELLIDGLNYTDEPAKRDHFARTLLATPIFSRSRDVLDNVLDKVILETTRDGFGGGKTQAVLRLLHLATADSNPFVVRKAWQTIGVDLRISQLLPAIRALPEYA